MTTAPFVELRFNPTDLRPQDLPRAGAFLGSPAEALETALAVTRATMVDQMREELRGIAEPTQGQLLRIADLAWQAGFFRFRKVSAPIIADAYIRAYRRADAGDVPMSVIYDLADRHAEKVGEYFHTSSRQALAEGFTGMVNRRIPARVATNRALDAYGLTPRQMRAYTAAKQFETPVTDVLPRSLKAKARAYIDKSFTSRVKKMARQEEHNIDQQAQQFAWMWLQDKGRLPKKAEKLWITAKDERVCEICGPLHGQKVKVNERFTTSHGEFWTPGLHPNCRCVVRLLEHRFSKAQTFDPRRHPRGGDPENPGRFSRKSGPTAKERSTKPVIETEDSIWESLKEAEPEEGKVSMTPPAEEGKLSMGGGGLKMGGLSMGGGVSMGGGLSMTEPSKEGKVSMTEGQGKVSMTREEAHGMVSMLTTPQMQMEMNKTLMTLVEALEPYVKPTRRPLESIYEAKIKIQDDAGHEYPVYAVVEPHDLNWSGDKVELNHTVSFTPSLSRVASDADAKFKELIVKRAQSVMESNVRIGDQTDSNGVRWVGDLDDAQVLEVVNWVAYQGRTTDPDTALGYQFDYELVDGRGNRKGATMPIAQAARLLRVNRNDFDVRILRMDEGHDSRDGTTVMEAAGTKGGYENWVTSGRYNATTASTEEVGHNLAIKVFWIDPDVREVKVPWPGD